MKTFLTTILCGLMLVGTSKAATTISALPAKASLADADPFIIDDIAGAATKKVLWSTIKSQIQAANLFQPLDPNLTALAAVGTALTNGLASQAWASARFQYTNANLTALQAVGTALTNGLESIAGAAATYQPLDADLTALAANLYASTTLPGIITTQKFSLGDMNPMLMDKPSIRLPPMGMNSYAYNGTAWINETDLTAQIDCAFTNGLAGMGWRLILIDSSWSGTNNRAANGTMQPVAARFPSGIRALADYAHNRGQLLGIYAEPYLTDSTGSDGSTNFAGDAANFISWGIDYVQFDNPGTLTIAANDEKNTLRAQFIAALQNAQATNGGRPLYMRGTGNVGGNKWDTYGLNWVVPSDGVQSDYQNEVANIYVAWTNTWKRFRQSTAYDASVGPGHFFSSLHLYLNFSGMDTNMAETIQSMYAIQPLPLITTVYWPLGTYPTTDKILTNQVFIAINQDDLVAPGIQAITNATWELWVRPLANGDRAVWAVNVQSNATAAASFTLADIGFEGRGPVNVYDVWKHTNGSISSSWSWTLPAYGSTLLRCSPSNNWQIAADRLTSGTIADARISSAIARVDGSYQTNAVYLHLAASDAYGAGWENNLTVPDKGALYTKIQSMSAASGDTVYANGTRATNPNIQTNTQIHVEYGGSGGTNIILRIANAAPVTNLTHVGTFAADVITGNNVTNAGNITTLDLKVTGTNSVSTMEVGTVTFTNPVSRLNFISGAGDSAVITNSFTNLVLTAGRVPIVGTGSILADDADLTFSGDTLVGTKIGSPLLFGDTASMAYVLVTNKMRIVTQGNAANDAPTAFGQFSFAKNAYATDKGAIWLFNGTAGHYLVSIPTNTTLTDTYLVSYSDAAKGFTLAAPQAPGSGDDVYVEGSNISNPNFKAGTGVYIAAASTNATIYVTNVVDEMLFPASAFSPGRTNAATYTTNLVTGGTYQKTIECWSFSELNTNRVCITFPMPSTWNAGAVKFKLDWTSTNSTGNVVWAVTAAAMRDDDALTAAWGTAVTVTDGVTAANDEQKSGATGALTIGGTPAAGCLVTLQVYRDPSDGSDSLVGSAELLGVTMQYTRSLGATAW